MHLNSLALLDLQPQDRIVTMTKTGYGDQRTETTLYVVCADLQAGLVHTLTASGNSQVVAFDDIQDVEKCTSPVTVVVNEFTWRVHGCDPAYLGKPVRAICAMLSKSGTFDGLHVPKWPGSKPQAFLTLDYQPQDLGAPLEAILSSLPTNRHTRYHDPMRNRNLTARTAGKRFASYLHDIVGGTERPRLPVDPSMMTSGKFLVQRTLS